MNEAALCARISAMIEGFVYGLQRADPDAGFGCSEPFDSGFWSILSILEGNAQGISLDHALQRRLTILLGSDQLPDETRSTLERFADTGDLYGGVDLDASAALTRTLGVALCETSRQRRIERAVQVVGVTHFSPLAAQTAIALVEIQAYVLGGSPAAVAIESAREHVEHPLVLDVLHADATQVDGSLSAEHTCVDALRWVVWSMLQADRPQETLEKVVVRSGKNPVAMALSGAVLAACDEHHEIPPMVDLRSEEIAEQITYWRGQLRTA